VTDLDALSQAVSEFATRAAEKLRRQHSFANQVMVFVHTSPFRPGPKYAKSIVMPLRRPSSDTQALVQAAVRGMRSIFKPGYQMAKAGVMLMDLQPDTIVQGELDLGDEPAQNTERPKHRLMSALDSLNDRYGKGTLLMASSGLKGDKRSWAMRQERRTPRYTTSWDDLPVARC
jgi:DNA polymerase V